MSASRPITFSPRGEIKYKVIGTYTRYSSWTARVVTLLEYFQIPYTAQYAKLSEVRHISKSGLVPILVPMDQDFGGLEINDSLSICEFLAEMHPELPLWPKDPMLRARARSAVAEMHSGFHQIRSTFHSNYVAKYTGTIPIGDQAKREIDRLFAVLNDARRLTSERLQQRGKKDGGFLFGDFGIADAFFWPVLWRIRSYQLPLTNASPEVLTWMQKIWSDPTFKALGHDYFKQMENQETFLEGYEDIFKDNPGVKYGYFEKDWEFEIES